MLGSLPTPKYEYVTSQERAKTILSQLERHKVLAMDTETTALDVFYAKLVLLQISTEDGDKYIFDMRYDTEFSDIHPKLFIPLFLNENILKIFQNGLYDLKILKLSLGIYVKNVYDTMLAEQLLNLGLNSKANLKYLVEKYLYIDMPKEPAKTFSDYGQQYRPFQLEYAINDVVVLDTIMKLQKTNLISEGLMEVAQLEFDFIKPLSEMELNGILIDVNKWRTIINNVETEAITLCKDLGQILSKASSQTSLFGVSLINVDSQKQLLKALRDSGLKLESTDVKVLNNYIGVPVIDKLLEYRKKQKLVSTYGETLLDRINPITGRLHTAFKQLVSTGRLSSTNPNLQNIPAKQLYRSCFIAKEGYSLITSDMASAELRVIGNFSKDPGFIKAFRENLDLHTQAASAAFKIPYDKVTADQRKKAKGLSFGLPYGISSFGLSKRLNITEEEAQAMIDGYFDEYKGVKKFLDTSAHMAVNKGYVRTISGRKRYFKIPELYADDSKKILRAIAREAKNAPIQGSNADTMKKAMVILQERLEKGNYDAKLLLNVHDEAVIESRNDQVEEVAEIVKQSIIDGFGHYFDLIPMETVPLKSPCWMKGGCENKLDNGIKCDGTDYKFLDNDLICEKCGSVIK